MAKPDVVWRGSDIAAIADQVEDYILLFDAQLRVLFANAAVTRPLGHERIELVGRNLRELEVPDTLRQAWEAALHRVAGSGTAEALDLHPPLAEAPRPLPTRIVPLHHANGRLRAILTVSRNAGEHPSTEALKRNEERLERALLASDLGMWDWDIEENRLYVDRYVAELLNYAPEEVPADLSWLIAQIHPEDRDGVMEQMTRHLKGQCAHFEHEFRARHRNGEWRWIASRGQVVERGPDGRARRMTGTNQDITERQRLRDSLERALAASGLGMWDWNVETGALFIDARCYHNVGRAPGSLQSIDELIGLMHEDDIARVRRTTQAHLAREEPYYEYEARVRTQDGAWTWVHCRGQVTLRDDQGRALRATGTLANVDTQKRVQESLDRANREIQLLLDATDEGIIGLNPRGMVGFVNPAATRMLGYTAADMLGRDIFSLIQHVREDGSVLERQATPIQRCLDERRRTQSSDELFWRVGELNVAVEYSIAPILTDDPQSGAVLIFHDVGEKRSLAQQLRFQAMHDPLTGLVNRRGFEVRLTEMLAAAKDEGREHALLYLDLDQFKLVNDTCGHAAGDELLRQLPKVLQPIVRQRDTIARLGGDEFAILLEDCSLDNAAKVAEAARDAVKAFRFIWQYRTFSIGVSIGVVGITAESQGLISILGAADTACYVAKDQGPNNVHVSYPHDLAIIRRRGEMRWVARIKTALEDDRFTLYFQSIASFERPEAAPGHHEVLIRLLDAKGEIIPPSAFMTAAERYQLMPSIDQWVIESALRYIGGALAVEGRFQTQRFGINLSGESLRDHRLLDHIRTAMLRHGVPPTMLYFEITETAAISNLGAAVDFMRGLKQLGCELALDDFGSGMSSFSYLKHLPVDYLKIDGSFVKDLLSSPVDQAIVRAINSVGQRMGIRTIAEYVENQGIYNCLREMGVNYAQGFNIARPQPLDAFPMLYGPRLASSA